MRGIARVTTWVIGIINVFTKSPRLSKQGKGFSVSSPSCLGFVVLRPLYLRYVVYGVQPFTLCLYGV